MLAFIDESGYPRPTDTTNNPVLLCVCIKEQDIKPITNQIYKLKDNLYGKQDEIKATNLIREATITKNRTINKAYTEGIVKIVSDFNAYVFAILMERPDTDVIVPDMHFPRQYYLLLKKIEFFSRKHRFGKTIMIFDEINEESDRRIAEALTGFFFRTNLGRSFSHVLEMPLFVSSEVTPSIQLADIFAGIVRHYYEHGLDQHEPVSDYEKWLESLFSQLFARTENNSVPGTDFIEYGFQRISNLGYHHNENTILTKSE